MYYQANSTYWLITTSSRLAYEIGMVGVRKHNVNVALWTWTWTHQQSKRRDTGDEQLLPRLSLVLSVADGGAGIRNGIRDACCTYGILGSENNVCFVVIEYKVTMFVVYTNCML